MITRKAMMIIALVLVAATAATAAVALACPDSRCRKISTADCQTFQQLHRASCDRVFNQVINANNGISQAMLRLKLKSPPRQTVSVKPPMAFLPPAHR